MSKQKRSGKRDKKYKVIDGKVTPVKKKTAKKDRVFPTHDGVAMPIFENGIILHPPNRKP